VTGDPAWKHVKIEVLRERFAAELSGVDLSRPMPPAALAEVLAAWAAYPVLCFPDQPLSPDQLEASTVQVGPFGEDPFVAPMPGHPNILEVRREPDEKAIVFGAAWHSDWSFQESPPSATLLAAKVIPPVGGDTLYADLALAFESLPDDLKEIALSSRGIHSAALAYGARGAFAREEVPRAMKILHGEEAHATWVHPMVRTHPVTGRRSLFVNPTYTCGVEGMSDEDGGLLLLRLYEHGLDERFVHRHRWRENMLLMWDNRCTAHNATGGYNGHLRVMHRTTVAGEAPVLESAA
jgi:taurine dioxygenase